MNIILLETVQNLGALGEQVSVKAGYGRNYLIPKGMAVPATKDNVAKFEARRAELEKAAADKVAKAEERKAHLDQMNVAIARKAGEEGKLFGSVGTSDIADALKNAGAEVSRSEINLPTGTIRQIGEYDIIITLHSDITASVKINVVAE